MSFLQNLYAKVIPDVRPKRKDSHDDKSESPVFEDFDMEDGFVIFTGKDTSRAENMETCHVQERLEYNSLQTSSAPGYHNPSGSSLPACLPTMNDVTTTGIKDQSTSTFFTVSDIPLKLSKTLEMIHDSKKILSYRNLHPIDIGEFFYDFQLEKTVINFSEGDTREER